MVGYPVPKNEKERIKILNSYQILDSAQELVFDRITTLASRLFESEIALLTFVDNERQWFKSKHGLNVCETNRSSAFCAYTIMDDAPDVFVVLDASKDKRFCENPLVTGYPYIRFYAGAPIVVEGGHKLGSLCVISTKPRQLFSMRNKMDITDLAAMVVEEIKLRRSMLQAKLKQLNTASHELKTPLFCFSLCLETLEAMESSEENKKILAHAKGNLELMRWSVENSLASAKADCLGYYLRPKYQPFKVTEMVKKLQDVIDYIPRNVPVTFKVDSSVPEVVNSDLRTIIYSALNYITNSCQLTIEGEILIRVCESSSTSNDKDNDKQFIRISVEDTGPGVEDPSRLFRREFLLENDGSGLHAVVTQMEFLNGTYGYNPRPDGQSGSVFWLEFENHMVNLEMVDTFDDTMESNKSTPEFVEAKASMDDHPDAHTDNEEAQIDKLMQKFAGQVENFGACCEGSAVEVNVPVSARSIPSRTQQVPLRINGRGRSWDTQFTDPRAKSSNDKPNALVIDDNRTIRKMLKMLLDKAGFHVDCAEDGGKGLVALKAQHYTLVLCDFLMPISSGPDCIRAYTKWLKEQSLGEIWCPFIVGISANAEEKDIHEGLQAGMHLYAPKPVKAKLLESIVSTANYLAGKANFTTGFVSRIWTTTFNSLDILFQEFHARNMATVVFTEIQDIFRQSKKDSLKTSVNILEIQNQQILSEVMSRLSDLGQQTGILIHEGVIPEEDIQRMVPSIFAFAIQLPSASGDPMPREAFLSVFENKGSWQAHMSPRSPRKLIPIGQEGRRFSGASNGPTSPI
mmetsp:Transcript_17458/g.22657  ORF Transcript_17458/g.22657 Transcript_17458/m.22657 type:complete len:800 (-) Transcript_17458:518-2917(-)